MKKFISIAQVVIITLSIGLVSVSGTFAKKNAQEERLVKIKNATPENPVVSLGKAFDKKSGQMVEGYAIVHFARTSSVKVKPTTASTCYKYTDGVKWKTVEPWIVDPVNTGGLGATFILANMTKNITKWEDATDGVLGNSGVNVLGDGGIASAEIINDGILNGLNEVTFAGMTDNSIIAVNTVWGLFSVPVAKRQLVEWDQVYNVNYKWSASGEVGMMDFENIATHELGHAFGLADLYTDACSQETMYGYAGLGQINKRDLNIGDVTGVNLLY